MFLRRFAKRVSGVLGRDLLVSITNFFITTYIANQLGPNVFGLWIGVLTLLLIFDLLFRLKIDQLIIFFSGQYPNNVNLYKKISFISLQALIIAGGSIYLFNELIIDFFSLPSTYFLLLVYFNFFISIFGNIILYIFLSESKYNEYNISIIIQAFVNGALIVLLFNLYEASLMLPIVSLTFSWLSVILFYIIHRLIKSRNNQNSYDEINLRNKDILKKGIFIYTSSAGKALNEQIPRLFAISFLTPAIVGFIGLAQLIINLINRIPTAINTVLYPMLVKEDVSKLEECFFIIRMVLILFIPIVLLLYIFMPSFILLLYGEEFTGAVIYIRMILPFILIGLPGLILTSYYASKGRFKDLLYIHLTSLVISTSCLYITSFFMLKYAPIVALNSAFFTVTATSIYLMSNQNVKINIIPSKNDILKLLSLIKSFLPKS